MQGPKTQSAKRSIVKRCLLALIAFAEGALFFGLSTVPAIVLGISLIALQAYILLPLFCLLIGLRLLQMLHIFSSENINIRDRESTFYSSFIAMMGAVITVLSYCLFGSMITVYMPAMYLICSFILLSVEGDVYGCNSWYINGANLALAILVAVGLMFCPSILMVKMPLMIAASLLCFSIGIAHFARADAGKAVGGYRRYNHNSFILKCMGVWKESRQKQQESSPDDEEYTPPTSPPTNAR